MPFFLVTQTTLIEAESEEEAAENTLHRIRESKEVTFSVKYDEQSIKRVVVVAPCPISSRKPIAQEIEKQVPKLPEMAEQSVRSRTPFVWLPLLFAAGFGCGGLLSYVIVSM